MTPGTYAEYHIIAYNVAGSNDFAGVNATTLLAAPTGLSATPSIGAVNLNWSPVAGAVSYNIYRGATSGGESTTPLATGVTATSYIDPTATPNIVSYYVVTAVNANGSYTPPLPAEGTSRTRPRRRPRSSRQEISPPPSASEIRPCRVHPPWPARSTR